MGRSCQELLSREREPLKPGVDFLLAETRLRLGDGEFDGPGSNAAGLVSFLPDSIERARIRALAASFLTGRVQTHVLDTTGWTQGLLEVFAATTAVDANLVFALPTGHNIDLGSLPPIDGASGIRLAVTDDPAAMEMAGVDGVIYARSSPGESAAAVFKMLASLLAPETYTCLDPEDLLVLFEAGRPAEIAEAVWVQPGSLMFRTAADQGLVESSGCAAVFLSTTSFGESQETQHVVSAVRRHMRAASVLLVHDSIRFLAPAWPNNGALPVSVLCSRLEARADMNSASPRHQ